MVAGLERLHLRGLVLRQHLGAKIRNAGLRRDGLCGGAVVAAQHHHFDTHGGELRHGGTAAGAQLIGEGDITQQRAAARQRNHALALLLQRENLRCVDRDALVCGECR